MGVLINKSIKTSIVNYIGVVIGAISVLFIQTYFLTEQEIGAVKTIISIALLILPFSIFGLDNALVKFYPKYIEEEKSNFFQFISYIITIPIVILIGFLLAYFVFSSPINELFENNFSYIKDYLFVIPMLVFYYMYSSIFEALMAINQNIIVPSFLKNINIRIYYIILIVLYGFNLITFFQLVILFGSLHVLNILVLAFLSLKEINFKYQFSLAFLKTQYFKEMLKFSAILLIGSASGILVAQLDIIMTSLLTVEADAAVGVYTVAFFIGNVIEIPKRPFIQLIVPFLAKYFNEDNFSEIEKLYKQSSINLLIIGLFIFLLIWTSIDQIFEIIPNGEIYKQGKYVVLFIGLAKLFDMSVGINAEIIQYSPLFKWNLFFSPFLALLTITTNYYFIQAYGIVGTSIATAITIFIYNALRSLLVYKKMGMNSINLNHLKVIIISLPIFYLCSIIPRINSYLDIFINTALISVGFIAPIYFFKISNQFNDLIDKSIKLVFK